MTKEEINQLIDKLAHAIYNADEQLLNEINFKVSLLKDKIKIMYKRKHLSKIKEFYKELDESLNTYFQEYIPNDDEYIENGNEVLKELNDFIEGL